MEAPEEVAIKVKEQMVKKVRSPRIPSSKGKNTIAKKTPTKRAHRRKPKKQFGKPITQTDWFLNMNTGNKHFLNEDWVKEFAMDMVKWAQESDSIVFNDYLNSRGDHSKTLIGWEKRFPNEAAAKEMAKQIIGARRETGAAKRELDPSMIKFNQPQYDHEWKELLIWREEVKAKAIKDTKVDSETKVIVIEKFKDNDERAQGE